MAKGALPVRQFERTRRQDAGDEGFEYEDAVTDLDSTSQTLVLNSITVTRNNPRFNAGSLKQFARQLR